MAANIRAQISQIEKNIMNKIQEIMKEDVASEVIKEGQKQVIKEVYEKYTPIPVEDGGYERTYGLLTEWEVESIENGIIVRNTREDGGKYLPEVIETGEGYDYTNSSKPFAYEKPRPFLKTTRRELKKNKNHIKILKKELSRYVKIK